MMTDSDHETFEALLVMFGRRFNLCVVDKRKFDLLPATARSYAIDATPELLDAAGVVLQEKRGEVYICASEGRYYRCVKKLLEQKEFEHWQFTSVSATPSLLLEKTQQANPKMVHFNYGSDEALTIAGERLAWVEEIAFLADLAVRDELYVIQSGPGFAFPIELDGKTLALTFTSESEAEPTLEGFLTTDRRAGIGVNHPQRLAEKLLESQFEGLVLCPATSAQRILAREQVELLGEAARLLNPYRRSWLKRLLKV